MTLPYLLAQAAEKGQDPPFIWSMMPILAMVAAFYFLMLRPMQKQEKQRQALLTNLKKNAKVLTQGGLYGIVVAVSDKDDEVTLKVDEGSNLRLKVSKGSIVRVITPEEPGKETKDGGA